MFEARLLALRQRQLELRLRQAELRAALATDAARLKPVLAVGDLGLGTWRRWRDWSQAPAGRWSAWGLGLLAGIAGPTVARRWRRWLPIFRLARAGYGLWQAWPRDAKSRADGPAAEEASPASTAPEVEPETSTIRPSANP